MEGDNSHVEMKLSSDMDDEVEANGVGENTNQHNHPYYPSKLNQRSPKTICGYVIGILFLFIIGKQYAGIYIQAYYVALWNFLFWLVKCFCTMTTKL